MQRIGPNALTHSFNWKSPRFAELQRQVQLQQTERIHTVNQQVSFHATNWTKCAHSLIQLEIAKVVLQRQVQLQQTERVHTMNQQGSFHTMNWTKCAHSLIQFEIEKDLLNKNLLQRQVQLQQTERIHTVNQQLSFMQRIGRN